MPNKQLAATCIAVCLLIISCSKKQVPEHTTAVTTTNSTSSTSSNTTPVKKVVKREAAPRVIVVNDKAAKKSFDGRLYYDVNGRRYWRNYNDGKYYLFDKSMYSDSAFVPRPIKG